MNKKIWIIIILLIIYLILKYPVSKFLWFSITYPINLIVTFLHEFWHSFFAYITLWKVSSVQVNPNWSWLAMTVWWIRTIVIAWGYIGSALFWNLLLYISFKKPVWSEKILYSLSGLMIFVSIFFFSWIISTIVMLIIAWLIILLIKYSEKDDIILQFIWIATLCTIIEDFRIWPSSDLSKFSEIFIFIPTVIWMYIWLILVLALTIYNIKIIAKESK